MIFKPRKIIFLEIEHQAILSGVRKGKSYRQMAKDLGKSLGTIQMFVEELIIYGALERDEKKIKLTQKGKEVCSQLSIK